MLNIVRTSFFPQSDLSKARTPLDKLFYLPQRCELIFVWCASEVSDLGNVDVCSEVEGADSDLHEVLEIVVGESLDFLGPGS